MSTPRYLPAKWAVGVVAALALLCALAAVAQHSVRRTELQSVRPDPRKAALERTLHALESRLSSMSSGSGNKLAEMDDILDHAAPESTGTEEPLHPAPGINRLPGEAWTAEDQEAYDKEMQRAVGETEHDYEEEHLPSPLMPISDPNMQKVYAKNAVRMMRQLNAGYIDELLSWAESGSTTENDYIAPLVEGIEAPLVKELDAEAHAKVKETVHDIGLRKDLSAAEMKKMRARLLVPLLLRIRARVHHQVELYTVQMLRKVIVEYAKEEDKGVNPNQFVPPAGGEEKKPSEDEELELTLRDIDALHAKGVLSDADYEAQKAKTLSDWLGVAIKDIGGKEKARKALEEFLWPPVMTKDGCKCLLPFKYDVPELSGRTIEYHECTDIGQPGEAWCAVDPDDEKCGQKSKDHRAHKGEDGLGWERWDTCVAQPEEHEPGEPLPEVAVKTERGCTCRLPFEFYPQNMGGRSKVMLDACTTLGGVSGHWCATEGTCGRNGNPETGKGDSRLSWTHWDKCVGEPAGYLEPAREQAKTVQGCSCRETWKFKPKDIGHEVVYGGCTDVDTPGTAWCAVDGHKCGTKSDDPDAGTGHGKYGWTKWDVCEKEEQPTEVQEDLEKGMLPYPVPLVRTESGCSCMLPWKISTAETGNKLETQYSCQRYDANYAWCPVSEKHCGHDSLMYSKAHKGKGGWGWTHWDKCVGDPPGFLAPEKTPPLTAKGCKCKMPWKYESGAIPGREVTYIGCSDIDSPNKAWCAVDPELSDEDCGMRSHDSKATLSGYGWTNWDYCMDEVKPHEQGVLPDPVEDVKTLNGCTCALPYDFTPSDVGVSQTYTTCNRYGIANGGTHTYWWCPVTDPSCGRKSTMPSGEVVFWDKCIGEAPGYLEPTPVETEQGCECLLPFEYGPDALKDLSPNKFTYTTCVDIQSAHGGAWCATRGACGTASQNPDAHLGPGGYGWTHWDKCKAQPEARAALPDGQPQLPMPVPALRTQSGCRCKLPFEYAPASDCSIEDKDSAACEAQGGDLQGGWCVTCISHTYTECIREDQDAAWCAVDPSDGDCGVKSQDYKSKLPLSEGGYGWDHWDHCIGEPAGFMAPRSSASSDSATHQLAQRQGASSVTVESVTKRLQHEHSRGRDGGADSEVKELARRMSSSLRSLDKKIQQLDEHEASPAATRAVGAAFAFAMAMAAMVAALVHGSEL